MVRHRDPAEAGSPDIESSAKTAYILAYTRWILGLLFVVGFFFRLKKLWLFPPVFGALKGNQVVRSGYWTVSAPLYGYSITSNCSCTQSLTPGVTLCANKMKSAEEGEFNFCGTVAVA